MIMRPGNENVQPGIAAVIAAAGRSRRMGRPKQLLPWGGSTVIATVVQQLQAAGASPILCILGHEAARMREALRDTAATLVYNEEYGTREMLASYQVGVRHLLAGDRALIGTLIALSDQPHIPVDVIGQVMARAMQEPQRIIIPSHQMRRGHPIFLPATLWAELLALEAGRTLRDLINVNADRISYVVVEHDAILRDMDTPDDYARLRPEA